MIYAFDVLTHLIASDLIALSETSSEDGFRFKGGKIEFYLPLKVRWRIRYESPVDLIQEIESRARDGYWPASWLDQVKDCWTELAIAECQEFFEYIALQRGFPPAGENATIDMLSSVLKTYSVAQTMQILLKGAKDAADFRARTNCSLQHGSNYMIGASRRYADRATAEKWTIAGLRRNYDLPQSALSTVLHDVFLRHGEKGFTECPHEWH